MTRPDLADDPAFRKPRSAEHRSAYKLVPTAEQCSALRVFLLQRGTPTGGSDSGFQRTQSWHMGGRYSSLAVEVLARNERNERNERKSVVRSPFLLCRAGLTAKSAENTEIMNESLYSLRSMHCNLSESSPAASNDMSRKNEAPQWIVGVAAKVIPILCHFALSLPSAATERNPTAFHARPRRRPTVKFFESPHRHWN